MKAVLQAAARRLVGSDRAWTALDRTLLQAARHLTALRGHIEREREVAAAHRAGAAMIAARIPDLTVRSGPFAGMKYPSAQAAGSELFPKLIGSYESELSDVIGAICSTPYEVVIDIGCAEGYYAVGLALRIPTATVHAFDIDPDARRLCRQMAELNGVAGRVVLGERCGPETIRNIPAGGRGLILCDCEGYELELFTDALLGGLSGYDLLIETHDFITPGISAVLRERLAPRYVVERIHSLDDAQRAVQESHPLIADCDLSTRTALLAERRPAVMEWLFCRPRQAA